jgi:hypothetical protein
MASPPAPRSIFASLGDAVLYTAMKLFRRVVAPPRGRPSAPTHEAQAYYLDGYVRGTFKTSPALVQLNATTTKLRAGDLRPGFAWEQKYPHTQDLRPNVYEYDPVFVDVLFESDVPALVKRVTGLDLVLAHIQLRRVFPGTSYMDWHRDTYIYGGAITGNLPPVHKLIFYPATGSAPQPRLRVSPGSHRRMLEDRRRDVAQVGDVAQDTISSSDDGYIIFETSLLHAVVPDTEPVGSIRVIYQFCHDFQLEAYRGSAVLQDAYRSRVRRG